MFLFITYNIICFKICFEKKICFDINIASLAFCWLEFVWCIILHSFTLKEPKKHIYVFYLKWVSYKLHRVSLAFIHCKNPCLLIGIVTLFVFNIIFDMVGLKSAILLAIFYLFHLFSIFSFILSIFMIPFCFHYWHYLYFCLKCFNGFHSIFVIHFTLI